MKVGTLKQLVREQKSGMTYQCQWALHGHGRRVLYHKCCKRNPNYFDPNPAHRVHRVRREKLNTQR